MNPKVMFPVGWTTTIMFTTNGTEIKFPSNIIPSFVSIERTIKCGVRQMEFEIIFNQQMDAGMGVSIKSTRISENTEIREFRNQRGRRWKLGAFGDQRSKTSENLQRIKQDLKNGRSEDLEIRSSEREIRESDERKKNQRSQSSEIGGRRIRKW